MIKTAKITTFSWVWSDICPNLARSAKGVFGLCEMYRQFKIVQNESPVN